MVRFCGQGDNASNYLISCKGVFFWKILWRGRRMQKGGYTSMAPLEVVISQPEILLLLDLF
jgi:hypothetical protein